MERLTEVKFIIADIDGTIVNEARDLTPKTKEILQAMNKQGILFGIASGRPVDEVSRTVHNWDLGFEADCYIGMNGAELFDLQTQKQYDYYILKKEWIKEIIDLMKPFSQEPYIYSHGVIKCVEDNLQISKSAQHAHKDVIVVEDISELYEEDNGKVMFRLDENKMAEVEAHFEALNLEHYKAFKTQPTLIEFANRKVSKAYALHKFCEMRGIAIEHVAAFGDTSNDNDMLEASGIGVCLKNGTDDTKAIADYITQLTNEEDGFADFVAQYILN
ncbi:hypothetical protein AOC36_07595 [Erysipelothrix larvae]|uniref:Hydrolase n=1 Tax=Erysipelothrix larvae TaxID=1514105 RepID=A0A0X8H0J3_9FIRM|nr:Cof-type HAD-IIB family hydrolase [Erysipelothrix larvae]AMC93852.1 hypothetical protein AOC36_07595 [Erysipelothrix larvae]